jgi:hypothetical protein
MKKSLQQAKEIKRWLKSEWIDLWINKYDDTVNAEGIAIKKYSLLEVDSGEIIQANRDFKPLSFHNILKKHVGKDFAFRVDIDPVSGGWRKFASENLSRKDETKGVNVRSKIKHTVSPQMRKGGAGWLNRARILKKRKLMS